MQPTAHQPSASQEQLWFLHQLDPTSPTYNVPWRLRLRGPLDVDALQGAYELLGRRHDALRTRFPADGGGPRRVVDDQWAELPVVDLADRPQRDAWRLAEEISASDAQAPFDLERGPLARGRLLRIAGDDHLLLMTVHHIVVDGWSFGILGDDLAAAYAAAAAGRRPALPPPAATYDDFVARQRELLAGDQLDELLAYWRDAMANAPTVELPADRARPARLSGRGRVATHLLPADLAAGLRELAETRGATTFMALMTGFKALLSRYTRSAEVVVGSAFLNRTEPEFESVVGFFANMLPVRSDLDGDPSFAEALTAVRGSTLAALAHQELPFGSLVEALRPRRDPSRNPLMQVGLTYNGDRAEAPDLPGLAVERVQADTRAARLDLNLEIALEDGALTIGAEYSADLYERETIVRLLERYETLLADAVADSERPIGALRLEERPPIRTATEPAPDTPSVTERFERQARSRPDAPAVVDGADVTSYAELDAQANRLAHHLRACGVRGDDLVAICLERSAAIPRAILGVLKAGAGYVPLDPSHPRERLRFMLDDAEPAAVVTDRAHRDALGATAARVVVLDEDAESISARPDAAPARGDRPDRLAYVIYTSGSTGRPKGVQIEHRNVTRLFTATDRWYGFSEDDVWALFHSYAFDVSVWELWGALAHGGRLVIVPYATSRSPQDFHELVRREGVTVLNQTPTAFAGFMRADMEAERRVSAVRLVITAGEALDVSTLEPWFDAHGDRMPRFVNMYGITETTVHSSYRPIEREDVHKGRSPIGEPIPDLAFHLVDDRLRPMPDGVPGELLVAGAGVGRGYLNRDDLAAQRFIDDPFARGRRCYRSGDLARRAADGELEYLGRMDDQVKIRGFRVELGEVRAALVAHDRVVDAVATVRDDAGEPLLVAYVVFDGEPVDARELHRFLRETLPAHEIPAWFVPIDAVPMTVNGKVDRRRLPAPRPEPAGPLDASEAPRTAAERAVAAAFRQVLGVERVGVGDDFFELGGHSLAATRLLAVIQSDHGCDVPLATFLSDPCVASLARNVDRRRASDGAPRRSCLVTLAEGAAGAPPLYLVHPIGGSVLCYQPLVEALDDGYPVCAFQLTAIDRRPPNALALASRYVAEMRPRPDGDFAIGGWSLGGLIAMEMATQLRDAGMGPAMVVALDAPPPGAIEPAAADAALAAEFAGDVARMLGRSVDGAAAGTRDVDAVLAAVERAVPELGAEDVQARWRKFRWLHRAASTMPARRYHEDVLLITAGDGRETAAAWRRATDGRVEHERVDADHYTLVDGPVVDSVADILRSRLERLDTRVGAVAR